MILLACSIFVATCFVFDPVQFGHQVLGKTPLSAGHQVPGRLIGYCLIIFDDDETVTRALPHSEAQQS